MPIRPDLRHRYPENWAQLSLRIRRGRAKSRCEECGAKDRLPHPETGSLVVLGCCHLNHVPEDCRPSNLRALCQRCHNRHDGKHRAWGRREREKMREGIRPMPFDDHALCARCGEITLRGAPCRCCGAVVA